MARKQDKHLVRYEGPCHTCGRIAVRRYDPRFMRDDEPVRTHYCRMCNARLLKRAHGKKVSELNAEHSENLEHLGRVIKPGDPDFKKIASEITPIKDIPYTSGIFIPNKGGY